MPGHRLGRVRLKPGLQLGGSRSRIEPQPAQISRQDDRHAFVITLSTSLAAQVMIVQVRSGSPSLGCHSSHNPAKVKGL